MLSELLDSVKLAKTSVQRKVGDVQGFLTDFQRHCTAEKTRISREIDSKCYQQQFEIEKHKLDLESRDRQLTAIERELNLTIDR